MTLTRGARITVVVLSAVLTLIVAGWIARDLATPLTPLELWRLWSSAAPAPIPTPAQTTGFEQLLLLTVYGALLAAALRPGLTAAAPAAVGAITLALWLPGLWVLSSSWAGLRVTDELRTQGLCTSLAALALGVGLLLTAATARRTRPTGPGRRMPVAASVLLGASAGVLAGWEIRGAVLRPAAYPDRFTGGEPLLPLLAVPPGWLTAVTVLLSAVSALAALRPPALIAAVFVLGAGVRGADTALRAGLLPRFAELPPGDRLLMGSWAFEALAGAAVLLLLTLGRAPAPEPRPVPPVPGPPPPASRPPGW
ncbi:hypothetical protein [Streptomyces jumonjinensis]|uniref:hypothetical protein n=1 Tax=Streptomyces jumonjinensis TaxID=1945 RepID=UPI0037BB265D